MVMGHEDDVRSLMICIRVLPSRYSIRTTPPIGSSPFETLATTAMQKCV